LNLDTHVLVDYLTGSLAGREEQLVFAEEWAISPVVLWELFDIRKRGLIAVDLDARDLQHDLQRLPILPLTVEVARIATRLDFRTDPIDEIVAATSIHYRAPLLTRDARVRESRMVPFAV
jgi:predicted nucleic acid-binding protein